MRSLLILLFLTFSISSFAKSSIERDTIANWQVYNGGRLLQAFNEFSPNKRIRLTRGEIRALDTFGLRYSDDTPCPDCNAKLTIKTANDEVVRVVDNSINNYYFDLKTSDLRLLVLKKKSKVLKFYYQESESDAEKLLFALEIR